MPTVLREGPYRLFFSARWVRLREAWKIPSPMRRSGRQTTPLQ